MSRTHVLAHYYGGGPLDSQKETIELENGRLPDERRCAMPLPPVTAEICNEVAAIEPLRVGVYRLISARQKQDPEGWPGDMVWTEADYRWVGERP